MKKLYVLLAALCMLQHAHALIVSVQGEGEVPEQGMELTVTEGEEDILTGQYTMELEGDLLTNAGSVTVQITRSASGLTDEFCCADNCTAGNGETTETKQFSLSGLAHWYAHYVPVAGSEETIAYTFSDGSDSRTITVHYIYSASAVEPVSAAEPRAVKRLTDGQLRVLHNGQWYTVGGVMIDK